MARASKTHHYSLFPHCTGTVSPMVNRNAIHSFVLFAVALFFQQSRFPVWTNVPKYAILNNLSQRDSKNIHFMATCESVYLRQQRQTLERGEVRFQEEKKKIKITTTFCEKQREKQESEIRWRLHFYGVSGWFWAWHWVAVFGYFTPAVWLSCHDEIKQPLYYFCVCFCRIYFHVLFVWLGALMRNQLSPP